MNGIFRNVFIFSILTNAYVYAIRKYTKQDLIKLREEVREMFDHAYTGYIKYAYPYDELRPLTCDGIDTWGSYSLTLIDALDTLAVMGNYSEFRRVVDIVTTTANFDANINVSVFETNIRIVGGLLSAHLFSQRAGVEVEPGWPCNGPLLRLAEDVAQRLLAAFNTKTGMPVGTVNLRYGVPPGETPVTCTAGVGTFILEFATLSRLTGDPIYEEVAMNALRVLFMHRSPIGLFGNHIDVMTGRWIARDSGIGAGVDSYLEYLVKGSILLQRPELMAMFSEARRPIDKYLRKNHWYVWASMHKGQVTLPVFQSLEAYWPGVLTLIGDIESALRSMHNYNSVWKQYGFTPEFYNIAQGEAGTNRESYPLRPELAESAMYLYRATGDPFMLDIGLNILRSIQHSAKTPCGYATIKDTRDHTQENRMESFFLAETTKYLYLLFDPDNFIHNKGEHGRIHILPSGKQCILDSGGYIFNTEAHPIDPGALNCCYDWEQQDYNEANSFLFRGETFKQKKLLEKSRNDDLKGEVIVADDLEDSSQLNESAGEEEILADEMNLPNSEDVATKHTNNQLEEARSNHDDNIIETFTEETKNDLGEILNEIKTNHNKIVENLRKLPSVESDLEPITNFFSDDKIEFTIDLENHKNNLNLLLDKIKANHKKIVATLQKLSIDEAANKEQDSSNVDESKSNLEITDFVEDRNNSKNLNSLLNELKTNHNRILETLKKLSTAERNSYADVKDADEDGLSSEASVEGSQSVLGVVNSTARSVELTKEHEPTFHHNEDGMTTEGTSWTEAESPSTVTSSSDVITLSDYVRQLVLSIPSAVPKFDPQQLLQNIRENSAHYRNDTYSTQYQLLTCKAQPFLIRIMIAGEFLNESEPINRFLEKLWQAVNFCIQAKNMNLYPNESPLHQAFTHVASHADRVWWNEKDYVDIYKMANLNLYKNILKLSNRPANNNSVDLLMNNLENEKIMSSSARDSIVSKVLDRVKRLSANIGETSVLDGPTQPTVSFQNPFPNHFWPSLRKHSFRAEQFFNWSFDACERRENSNNMMESYQALFELLKSKDAIESNNKPVLPYNLETMDDIILYSSLHQSSVKNLWAGEKSMQEVPADSASGRTDELQVYDSELNANVPEFYPSVLVPPLQCPPRYPSIYDANYQNELFPFKDDNWTAAHPHSVNVLQNSEIVWSYEESQSGASAVATQFLNGSSLPVEGSSSASASNLPTYTVSLSNSYSLAAADFPELPKTQDAAIDIIRKTNIWLEAAFPKKDQDFKKLTEVAAHLDSLIPQLTISQQGMICSQSKQPDRRLYRDVLAQKETEPEEKEDGGLEIKFEELEREALAQYRASETSLVPTVVTELSPELEENLEREALEQYSGDFHLELADEMLVQSKNCSSAAEDDPNENKPTASTSFDRDELEDVPDVKSDSQEKCMPTEELTPQLQERTLQQQLPAQIYQSKNKSRQRKGNKKKRGKWKGGGGGSSALAVVSSAGPSEDGLFDSRGDHGGSDFKSESGLNMSDCDNKLGASTGTKSNYFTYCEEENKRLCTELKQKALNYLKGVDLNLTGEIKRYTNKNTIKQLLYKGALPVPIVQSVKLEEIEDAETYKQYAKEVTNSARTLLLSMFKRIRTELMDTTSSGNIIIVAPTTAEKRKVRHKIQKCVRLLERADHLKRVPRKPVESARNEVAETLKLLHRTMEVVYGLKEITRTAYENLEYLRKSNEILLDIYLATTFIKDKTEYIQQRIFNDARNILLVLLFPRREGYLLDRVTQRLIVHPEGEQIGYVHRCYITDTCDILTRGPNLELLTRCPYNDLVRIWNVFKYEHHKKKDLWSEENWEHWLTIDDRFFAKVDLTLFGDVNILLLMNQIKNLEDDHINSRYYRMVSPNIINFCLPTTSDQYTCYFCMNNYRKTCNKASCAGAEKARPWCMLNELHIRAQWPLRQLMKSISQGMRSSECGTDAELPVEPTTSCTRIVQTDDQEDSSSDDNGLLLSELQAIPDNMLAGQLLPKKTRNNDLTCSIQ